LLKNKKALLEVLHEKAKAGDIVALALAYIINDICPEERTTKHVFRRRLRNLAEEGGLDHE